MEMVDTGAIDYKGNTIKVPKHQLTNDKQIMKSFSYDMQEAQKSGVGALTGISLESSESKHGTSKKQIDPDFLWLKSRFEGGGVMDMMDKKEVVDIQDLDEVELEEEQADVELNDQEAPFLVGQTSKTSQSLKPVKITANPDGSLQRAAIA